MRTDNKLLWGAAAFLIMAVLWGCAASRVQRRISLRYEGPKPAALLDPSAQAFPEIIVAPFADLRREKGSFGTYDWGNLSVNYIPGPESVSQGFTRLVREFLSSAGMRPVPGEWNGQLDTLPNINAEHAIFGEIERLDFSGRGRFYEAKNRGTIRVIIKWGNRGARRIITRTVEVAPDRREFHLFTTNYNHVSGMASLIRKTVSRAVRESMTRLFRSSPSRGK